MSHPKTAGGKHNPIGKVPPGSKRPSPGGTPKAKGIALKGGPSGSAPAGKKPGYKPTGRTTSPGKPPTPPRGMQNPKRPPPTGPFTPAPPDTGGGTTFANVPLDLFPQDPFGPPPPLGPVGGGDAMFPGPLGGGAGPGFVPPQMGGGAQANPFSFDPSSFLQNPQFMQILQQILASMGGMSGVRGPQVLR